MSTPAALRRAADALQRAIDGGDANSRKEIGEIIEEIGKQVRKGKITK